MYSLSLQYKYKSGKCKCYVCFELVCSQGLKIMFMYESSILDHLGQRNTAYLVIEHYNLKIHEKLHTAVKFYIFLCGKIQVPKSLSC